MKKIGFLICLIFALFIPFSLSSNILPVLAEETEYITIGSMQDFSSIQSNNSYKLSSDIDFNNQAFTPISNFSGVLDGNGYTIKNISITAQDGDVALFASTTNATIKNLQIENINIDMQKEADTYISKVAYLVANAVNTNIENISIISSLESENSINVVSPSSVYVGSVVANAKSATRIKNCNVASNITVDCKSAESTNYIGGICGYFDYSQAYNIVANVNISLSNIKKLSYVGGMYGYVLGNKSQIKNAVSVAQISSNNVEDEVYVGSILGAVSCLTDVPENLSINYLYTTLNTKYIGNEEEINSNFTNNIIDIDLSEHIIDTVVQDSLYLKDFYTTTAQFDIKNEWNFNTTWQISERLGLPFLQNFSVFNYVLSEDDSFSSLTKPNIQGNVIEFISTSTTFIYNGNITVSGYVTNSSQINKFYKIIGLRKDGEILFSNTFDVLDIINSNETTVAEVDENTTVYNLGSNQVTAVKTSINGNAGTMYYVKGKNVSWGSYTSPQGGDVNCYYINNCNITNQGSYSFVLETIKYNLKIETENIANGSIRLSAADVNVKKSEINEPIFYGQNIKVVATPANGFGFNAWKRTLDGNALPNITSILDFTFNETAFESGGIFENTNLGDEDLTFYATFTKVVCNITIKFAVNDEIVDDILSNIYINGVEIPPQEGVISKVESMGTNCTVRVVLPAGYEFTNWFLSDGTSNLGTQSEELEFVLEIGNEEDMMLIANFYKEEDPIKNLGYIWWIIGGSVIGIALIGFVVFLIVKKRKDNSYKNMYY